MSGECPLKQIQYGNNKDNDNLAQLNLDVIFGEESNLPFYYRKLSSNIPDVKTINKLLFDFKELGFNNIKLVLDRGFYSKDNIINLFDNNLKFVASSKLSLKYITTNLDNNIIDNIKDFKNYFFTP